MCVNHFDQLFLFAMQCLLLSVQKVGEGKVEGEEGHGLLQIDERVRVF